ncbi:beta-2 adrenergic receptor-like [Actinia tenebrosa]|uniref:Beta-2 adrenergic receptor-like n=1 Tax=Actinia tenebrosa TaxID=6105 RepID=A0A6P8ICI3_ACTTE|nr:beta-2 adrenergic receptor-like [Actinia tenebrosa]XP_031562705.1 beta-2 adrenergic receptor-like [Actinia tenebrosa]XP_031562706.1 beta-2 adrenergic receptor-like [Actinia tenebrosa]XP_031562707.1 beta-2 adrenergic receptor-like [Actinia tenebrosa]XP_031562708.1 beta-2 adrenergic receptor-like [Actinia tenebrosa]
MRNQSEPLTSPMKLPNLSDSFTRDFPNQSSSTGSKSLSLLELVVWSGSFGILAVAIFVGNALTIAVFTRKKLLRSRANYFLVSLAVADLLVGCITIPMYLYTLVSYWKHGQYTPMDFYYSYVAVDIFTGFASIFALTIIAIERLYAILWPLKHRIVTKRLYHFLVSLSWILSGFISIFYFLWSYQVLKVRFFFYLIIVFIFTSLIIICIAYSLIWIRLKFKICKRPRKPRRRFNDSIDSYYDNVRDPESGCQRRLDHDVILTTLCIVTAMFLITWVPFYILNIVVFFRGGQKGLPDEAFYFSKLLHYGNSLVNPIVYSIKIPKFSKTLSLFVRRKHRAVVKSLRQLNSRPNSTKSSSSQMRKSKVIQTDSTNI